MHRRGERPDAITWADTGGEKPGTYEFIPVFQAWLKDVGFPPAIVCRYRPLTPTNERYVAATEQVLRAQGYDWEEERILRLAGLFGNMVANATIPSLAFGLKSCSLKWKVAAQEPPRTTHPDLVAAWQRGEKVRKLIGFDATEHHRVKGGGTYAVTKKAGVPKVEGIPDFPDRYDVEYPLRTWGLNREACGRIIVDAGLPLPPKSACFFCPAMKRDEIYALRVEDPELHAIAIAMEERFRASQAFRGDDVWTVTGKHKQTGETETTEVQARNADDARRQFRTLADDTAKPYKYRLSASPAVPGLGRSFAWSLLPTETC